MTKDKRIIEILGNILYWETCPEDYKKDIRIFLDNQKEAIDPLDDESSELSKIGREIAEMSDEEFEANCKRFEKIIKK